MKKFTVLAALALVALVSCNKEKELFEPQQLVTYTVECDNCLVYVEDNIWNNSQEQDRKKNQHFLVSGRWQYAWTNTKLDSVQFRIVVSMFRESQQVKASISTNDGRAVAINERMGFNKDPRTEEHVFDRVLKLKLK